VHLQFYVYLFRQIAASAQRSVTNASLEKFRQQRLAAERDLRENYEKMGFPSPEELQRQNEESAIERDRLAEQLRQERLERERIAAEVMMATAQSDPGVIAIIGQDDFGSNRIYGYGYSYGGYGYGYGYPYGNYRDGRRHRGSQILWRAGPGGVIYEPGGRSSHVWSPTNDRPRPMFRQTTRRPVIGPRPIFRPR
jgi:hypothetical protein